MGGSLRGVNFDTDPGTYYAKSNDEILVIIMAETAEAVENIEDICSVPGLDAVFIGPNDLHASYGLPPNFESEHKQFNDALEKIRVTAKKVYTVGSGGNFIAPIFGPPKTIQGRVRYIDDRHLVVQAGCPIVVELPSVETSYDQECGPMAVGTLVNVVALPGGRFEPVAASSAAAVA